MQAYTDYLSGKLVDQPYDESQITSALAALPQV
jgi:tryptophan synthase beta chain